MGDGGRILPPGERSHYAIIGGARAATAQESPACRGSKPKGDGGDGCSEWPGRSRPGAGREGSVEETALVWAGVRQGQSGGVTVGRGVTGPPAMVVTRDSQCRVTHLYREQGTRSLSASLSSSEGGACDVSPCTRRPLSAQKLFSSVWGQSWSCFSSCPVRFSE